MSASEKTHMVVILVAVLGGVALLGCVAFGALFFIVAAPSAPAPVMMAPAPAPIPVQASVGIGSTSAIKVIQRKERAPGHYEITIRDTTRFPGSRSYEFKVLNISTPKTTVTVKSLPSGDPLPALLDTVLVVKTSPGQDNVQLQYQVTCKGSNGESSVSSGLILGLQGKQDGEALPKKESPKKQGSAPK